MLAFHRQRGAAHLTRGSGHRETHLNVLGWSAVLDGCVRCLSLQHRISTSS
jgi:hypothetical protein